MELGTCESFEVVSIEGETIQLHCEKYLYWPRQRAIILGDLHLGKAQVFRRAGIPAPHDISVDDLTRLGRAITANNAERLIVVGDMFHSKRLEDAIHFEAWRHNFPNVQFHLIRGNHDSRHEVLYSKMSITLHSQSLSIPPFLFIHDALDSDHSPLYRVSAHIHPGVVLKGRARQKMTLPCFVIGEKRTILPAFGTFTGLAKILPQGKDRIFCIVDDAVHEVYAKSL